MRTRPLAIWRALGTEVSRRRVSYLAAPFVGRGSPVDGLEDDAVDDGFDGVVLALFEAHAFGEFGDLAVDAGAEALLVEGFELFAELAFAAADDGGVDGDAFAGGEADDALDDLLGGLAGDGAAAVGAVGLADAGVEEAKVVVDLGDGADGGARAAARWSSARWRWRARGRRWRRRRGAPSGRGTGGRRRRGFRRSGAGLRRRWCRRRGRTCRSRRGR